MFSNSTIPQSARLAQPGQLLRVVGDGKWPFRNSHQEVRQAAIPDNCEARFDSLNQCTGDGGVVFEPVWPDFPPPLDVRCYNEAFFRICGADFAMHVCWIAFLFAPPLDVRCCNDVFLRICGACFSMHVCWITLFRVLASAERTWSFELAVCSAVPGANFLTYC